VAVQALGQVAVQAVVQVAVQAPVQVAVQAPGSSGSEGEELDLGRFEVSLACVELWRG